VKLPNEKTMTFVAKGKFFSNFTDLVQNETGALQLGSCSVVRTSRFNATDFSSYLESTLEDYLLFSSDLDYSPKTHREHITRDFGINRVSAEILAEVFGVKCILSINISFDRVVCNVIQENYIRSESTFLQIDEKFNGNLNNYFFDPLVESNPDYIDLYVKSLFNKLLDKLKGVQTDLIILQGEYVWTNSSNSLLEILIRRGYINQPIFIDKTAILEALLADPPIDSTLKMIHKSFFTPHFLYTGKNSSSKIQVGQKGTVYLDENKVNVVPLKESQTYLGSYTGARIRNLLVGKGDIKDPLSIDEIDYLPREDFMMSYVNIPGSFTIQEDAKYGIELRKKDIDNIDPQTIEGEFVEVGQVLAQSSSTLGLNTHEYHAHKEGYVSFKYIKDGYIFIYPSRERTYKSVKVKSAVVFRPRLILGRSFAGYLNKNIKYVSDLNLETYSKFIQMGAETIICRSIDTNLFWQVIRQGRHKFCSIVILDGIDIEIDNSRFVFDFLDNEPLFIDGDKQIVTLGIKSNTHTFFENFVSISDSKYKVGNKIRVIDNQRWGEYVRIISIDGGDMKIRSPNFNKVKLINLL